MSNYDVIIIGAGHNGLVAAAYLAKAGRRVLALEAGDRVGGAAVTEELFPGFRFSTCAGGGGYLAPEIARELDLASHGLEIRSTDPVVFAPQQDGTHLSLWRDPQRTAREIERFSKSDAAAYPDFVESIGRIAAAVGGLMRITPPDLPELGWADLASLRTLAGPMRKLGRKHLNDLLRILPMPVSDLLDEWFESAVLKGAIAANGVRDITWGPREAGTAYTLLYHWALSDAGLLRSGGHVRGGMGALCEALCKAAQSRGVEVRTGSRVERIVTEQGRATGVALTGGERLNAAVVVSNAAPRTTFLELLEPRLLPASLVRAVRNIKYRGSAARIHLALRELPTFTAARGGDAAELLSGSIQIAPTMMYLQKAYDCVKYGEYSQNPYLDVQIPSLTDPSLAPEGHHTMSITAKYAPYELRHQEWDEQRDVFADVVLATLAEYAPGIQDLVVHRKTLVPVDLEERFGLPEGNGSHGEMTLDQFLHMRPIPGYARYATPIGGLYLCGAGTHPGGGVTGIPGRNAARAIVKSG